MNVTSPQNTLLSIKNLTVGYGERIIQQDIDFTVKRAAYSH